jgi:hypothetical protein
MRIPLHQRFPFLRQIQADCHQQTEAKLVSLIEPYLEWTLAEVDTCSVDIMLLGSQPDKQGKPREELIVLMGAAANTWLNCQPSC